MNRTDLQQNPSVRRVEALKASQPDRFELWKYYEDRADHLGEQMWTIALWLMTGVSPHRALTIRAVQLASA